MPHPGLFMCFGTMHQIGLQLTWTQPGCKSVSNKTSTAGPHRLRKTITFKLPQQSLEQCKTMHNLQRCYQAGTPGSLLSSCTLQACVLTQPVLHNSIAIAARHDKVSNAPVLSTHPLSFPLLPSPSHTVGFSCRQAFFCFMAAH